jgi:hypothetical protein
MQLLGAQEVESEGASVKQALEGVGYDIGPLWIWQRLLSFLPSLDPMVSILAPSFPFRPIDPIMTPNFSSFIPAPIVPFSGPTGSHWILYQSLPFLF